MIERMTPEIIKKGRGLPKATKYHIKKLASNDTEKWYHSRTIWVGAGGVATGVATGNLELVIMSCLQILFRILTGKPIKLR